MEFDQYYFVFLRRNLDYVSKGEDEDKAFGARHFQFIHDQEELGNLLVAGPLDGAGGLYFFDCTDKSKDDILSILDHDDSIKYKMFIPEIHLWYIPKGRVIFPEKSPSDVMQ